MSARRQLLKAGASVATIDEELKPVELKYGTEWLTDLFIALNSGRQQGMSGPLPISHTEIKSYCELMDLRLTPWEVSTLKAMDSAFLEESYKLSEGMK